MSIKYVTHIYCENVSGSIGNGLYYANGELRVGAKNSGKLVKICKHLDSEVNTGIISLQEKGLNFGDVFWPWFGAEAYLDVGDNKWAWGSPKNDSSYTFGNGNPATGRYLCLRITMEGAINTVHVKSEIKDLYNDPLDHAPWYSNTTPWNDAVKKWRKQPDQGGVPPLQGGPVLSVEEKIAEALRQQIAAKAAAEAAEAAKHNKK